MKAVTKRRLELINQVFTQTTVENLPIESIVKKSITDFFDLLYYCIPVALPMYFKYDGFDVVNKKNEKEFFEHQGYFPVLDLTDVQLKSIFFHTENLTDKQIKELGVKLLPKESTKKKISTNLIKVLSA